MNEAATVVYIESRELYIVRRKRRFLRAWCAECGRDVLMMTRSEAAFIACESAESVAAMIAGGDVHVRQFESEQTVLCVRSLFLAC